MNRTIAMGAILAFGAGVAVGSALSGEDPQHPDVAAFRRALDEPDWLIRSQQMSAYLSELDADSLSEALEAIEPHLPWLVTDELRLFMLAWSRFDPEGALEQALAWPAPWNRNAAGAAMYAWGFRDPPGAREALAAFEGSPLHELMEARMIAGWAHGGRLDGLDEYLISIPEGPQRFKYVGMLAWELSKQGPDVVRQWAESAPAAYPRYKAAVFLKASSTLSSVDPEGTAHWLAGFLDRPYTDGVLRAVARSWAKTAPREALAWLQDLPGGPRRDRAVLNAFQVWDADRPEEARHWLAEAAPAAALDSAVGALAARNRDGSPAAALEWVLRLHDPDVRRSRVVRIAAAWLAEDPESAESWLAEGRVGGDVIASIRAARERVFHPSSAEDAG